MAITHTPIVDDDGSRTVGTIWNAAFQLTFEANIDAADAATLAAATNVDPGVCEGRLTLTTAVPVTTADVTAATTVYFTPYKGNKISLYSGSAWVSRTFVETSLALGTMTAGVGYDVFAYDSGGTLALEKVAWNSATTRFASGPYASVHPLQDGVKVKSTNGTAIDATRRYLGAFYARTTTTIDDSELKRDLSNYYHRDQRVLRRQYTGGASWTYTTATWRQANADAANQVEIFVGVAEVTLGLIVSSGAYNSTTAVAVGIAIGEDSTTAGLATVVGGQGFTGNTADRIYSLQGNLRKKPTLGWHKYVWLEYSTASGTTTWTNGVMLGVFVGHGGLVGSIEG